MVAPQTQSSTLKSAIQVAWIDRNNHSSSNGRILFIWFWWPYYYNDVMVPSQIAYVLGANCIQALPNRSTATRGWHWGTMQRGPTVGPQGCYL
eukprot:SAG25_NODE_484_length_7474_cov_11.267823_2_plen_93_part_00